LGEQRRWWEFNLKEARALLAAAGYPDGFRTNYYYTNNGYGTRFNSWAESVAAMMQEAGIRTRVIAQDYAQYIAPGGTFTAGPGSGMVFALQSSWTDPHDYFFNMLHSASERNHAGVKDPELDQLIDRSASIFDERQRISAIHDLQRTTASRMYYVPGCIGPDYAVTQPWVKNFQRSASYGWGTETASLLWLEKP
jgi:ABC-type transport system substrate-binding protein